jgi:signal transduction histidine kinase
MMGPFPASPFGSQDLANVTWHHSLYWRIALGFVACLALLLVVQAILFVWVVARSGRTVPNQPPDRLAQIIALDASRALERDSLLDLSQYLRQEYGQDAQPFFVLLPDGTALEIGGPFERSLVEEARLRFERMPNTDPPRFGPGRPLGRPDGSFEPPPPQSINRDGRWQPFAPVNRRGRGAFRPTRPAPIIAAGRLAGLVVVPPQPPFVFLLGRYAPVLGLASVATLVVGAVLAAIVIFGPARRRLRAVEQAARRLGSGDLTARAPEQGSDEVAAVASAFNAMATDLSARAAALDASDRARRQLLADVSHELTTPVTAIRGYLETLCMPDFGLDPETRRRYVGIIDDETSRLEHMIGDLLDLARIEGGGGAFNVEEVHVSQLFERVVARHERAAAERDVVFDVRISPGADVVRGDRQRLEQALQNLTANALRYAPRGSPIVLAARTVEGGVALSVQDSGSGISPEHQPHVFDRFYRVDSSRMRQEPGTVAGSGLGLSIVKAIVERHGGTISLSSAPGRTIFEIVLRSTSRPALERPAASPGLRRTRTAAR